MGKNKSMNSVTNSVAGSPGEIAALLRDHLPHLIERAYASRGMDCVTTVMRSLTAILTDETESATWVETLERVRAEIGFFGGRV